MMSFIFLLFQFQYGSIKRIIDLSRLAIYLACFNSNMVRLKATVTTRLGIPVRFQFQYGSIKSTTFLPRTELYFMFQFQYGSIKRQT